MFALMFACLHYWLQMWGLSHVHGVGSDGWVPLSGDAHPVCPHTPHCHPEQAMSLAALDPDKTEATVHRVAAEMQPALQALVPAE